MDCNYNKELHWNFYINLGDVADLNELDELLCIEKNSYWEKNEDDENAEEFGENVENTECINNKIKNINNIMEEINEQTDEHEHKNEHENENRTGNIIGNEIVYENGKKQQEREKNVIGEIIKAYIFCKNKKIKKACNLCLMSWIASKECWVDCDFLLTSKYFQNLLEPLIFICKALKEKVTHHFYQIPIEMHKTFLNNFKKYVTIYKDKEVIMTLLSSATSILSSKMS